MFAAVFELIVIVRICLKNKSRLWDSAAADSGYNIYDDTWVITGESNVSRTSKAVPFLLHQENTIINV